MKRFVRIGFSPIHYLFINHVISHNDVASNKTIENELSSFIHLYTDYVENCTDQKEVDDVENIIRDVVITELNEGCYFDDYSPTELKQLVKQSFGIITSSDDTVDYVMKYKILIDKAYEQYAIEHKLCLETS